MCAYCYKKLKLFSKVAVPFYILLAVWEFKLHLYLFMKRLFKCVHFLNWVVCFLTIWLKFFWIQILFRYILRVFSSGLSLVSLFIYNFILLFCLLSLSFVFPLSSCLPWWLRQLSVCLQCGRPRFDPWVGKKWQSTPVLLPGKSHGQRSLVGYSPWSRIFGHNWATSLHFTSLEDNVYCAAVW